MTAAEPQTGRYRLSTLTGQPMLAVAIVGAGVSGIAMGLALQQTGETNFSIFEKAETIGGTWRENTYPGLTCDVPAHYYAYRNHPNPNWSHLFAPRAEIQKYLERVVARQRLQQHIKLGIPITSAEFTGDHWLLHNANGPVARAHILVCATGVLHRIREPDIDGLDDFAGPRFHSARWDHRVDVHRARVGVIGSGSTGVQITCALAGQSTSVTLFQRTPQWVATLRNPRVPRAIQAALRYIPGAAGLLYTANQRMFDLIAKALINDGWQRRAVIRSARKSLAAVVDDDLRAALTPNYQPGCKRLVISPAFYRTIQRDDVRLVDEGIDRVVPEGIQTLDGTLHELDVLVTATGFDTHAYVRPMAITGRDGATIAQTWAGGPYAYRSTTVPGFPNMFLLLGPYSPLGNSSLVPVAEAQAGYVVAWLKRMRTNNLSTVEVTQAAVDAFRDEVHHALPNTLWSTGCDSWYLGPDGKPVLWPWTLTEFRRKLASPEPSHFVEIPRHRNEDGRQPAAGRAGPC